MKDDPSFDDWLREASRPAAPADAPAPHAFRQEVWRRIEHASAPPEVRTTASLWAWFCGTLTGPWGVTATVSCMVLAGGFAGTFLPAKSAAHSQANQEETARQAYTRSISPFAHAMEP